MSVITRSVLAAIATLLIAPVASAQIRTCSTNAQCNNGLFCDGKEVCVGARGAALGFCVSPGNPCSIGFSCNETTDSCVRVCTAATADADGDGHASTECGGDDCDDNDPTRYPGNREVCDADGRDEDCNPATFGTPHVCQTGDASDCDNDGYVSNGCGNLAVFRSGPRAGQLQPGVPRDVLGDDCNDANPATHPGQIEVCNHVDDNCNGITDEGVKMTLWKDVDGDGFGDGRNFASRIDDACPQDQSVYPPGSPLAGQPRNLGDALSTNNLDCNDNNSLVSPVTAQLKAGGYISDPNNQIVCPQQ